MLGKPVKLLILVGALNGLILPISLAMMLLSVYRKEMVRNYRHPVWMSIAGWVVVIAMSWMGAKILLTDLPKLWQ
jgi:Mn2+/Fe2+ NRAMP family transporter